MAERELRSELLNTLLKTPHRDLAASNVPLGLLMDREAGLEHGFLKHLLPCITLHHCKGKWL